MQPTTDQIKAARAKAKMSTTEAAAVVHKQARAWQRWESGDRAMCPACWELFQIKTLLK